MRASGWTAGWPRRRGELSRSALQALIEQGQVLRNGAPANKKDKIAPGDTVTLALPDPAADRSAAAGYPARHRL